jgi:hypothetical protein
MVVHYYESFIRESHLISEVYMFGDSSNFNIPCTSRNVGLYSPAGGKNELKEKKINIAKGESHKKNYRGKNQNSPTLQGY